MSDEQMEGFDRSEIEGSVDYYSPEKRAERLEEIVLVFSEYVAVLELPEDEHAELITSFREAFDRQTTEFAVLKVNDDKAIDAHDLPEKPFRVTKDDEDMIGNGITVLIEAGFDPDDFISFLTERGYITDSDADTSYQHPSSPNE